VERSKDVDSNFWETYKKVSTEYDDDFLARANDDMGIILTFVCFYLNRVQYKPDRRTRLVYSPLLILPSLLECSQTQETLQMPSCCI
jgi:hypothetical protein